MAFSSKFRPPSNRAFFEQIGFSAIAILLSLFFVWGGLSNVWKHRTKHVKRIEVPCKIEQFEITADRSEKFAFQPDLTFQYQWQGTDLIGTKLWPEQKGVHKYQELTDIRETLLRPSGKINHTTCFVNPAHPQDASLMAKDPGKGYGNWIYVGVGGVFALIGSLIVTGAIRQKQRGEDCSHVDATAGKSIAVIACGCFGFIGFAFLFAMLPVVLDSVVIKNWEKTSGTVEWSRIHVELREKAFGNSKRRSTSRVDIFYRYTFRDETYYSNCYSLVSDSEGYSRQKAIVSAYHPGDDLVCYVNPSKPWQAIVTREVGGEYAFFPLFSLPFLGIFFFCSRSFYREWRESRLADEKLNTHQERLRRLGRLRERWRK